MPGARPTCLSEVQSTTLCYKRNTPFLFGAKTTQGARRKSKSSFCLGAFFLAEHNGGPQTDFPLGNRPFFSLSLSCIGRFIVSKGLLFCFPPQAAEKGGKLPGLICTPFLDLCSAFAGWVSARGPMFQDVLFSCFPAFAFFSFFRVSNYSRRERRAGVTFHLPHSFLAVAIYKSKRRLFTWHESTINSRGFFISAAFPSLMKPSGRV